MKNTGHLPLYGVGPLYGAIVAALTVAGCVAGSLVPFGRVPQMKIPLLVIHIMAVFWHSILIKSSTNSKMLKP